MTDHPALVLLEDGEWFAGTTPWPVAERFGEVVFTTNLSGYQETFTDPSYRGQIVTMTAPMVGNYGVNEEDLESGGPQVSGVVVRELSRTHSNWRASGPLGPWLAHHQVPIIEGVDTRRLTRHIRAAGAMRGAIALGDRPTADLEERLQASPRMEGLDLASLVTVTSPYQEGQHGPHIVAYDFGMKRNIVRIFLRLGCRVTVVPAGTSTEEVLALKPDGLFLSNGPGDPAAVDYVIPHLRELTRGGLPTFGICLGHQLLAIAFGGQTEKLPYGHRGGNHPVRAVGSERVLITSQNHGFAVRGDENGVPGAPDLRVTHLNLNDGTVEGIRHNELPVFAVQYHPEASPGPHDAYPHFAEFLQAVTASCGENAATS